MKPTHPSEIMNSSITDSIKCDSKIHARHVSAIQLSQSTAPENLKQHSKINTNDKTVLDKAYLEEYMGLHDETKTWEYIKEDKFLLLCPIIGNDIHKMALATSKKDENSKPVQVKYLRLVLGNLDPN